MGSAFELQIVRRDIPSKALKRGKVHMSAKNPKKIKLIAVDGTKSTEELKRLLLAALENSGIPVRLTAKEGIKYGLDQPDIN